MKTFSETYTTNETNLDYKINAVKEAMAKEGRKITYDIEKIGNGEVKINFTYTDIPIEQMDCHESIESYETLKVEHDHRIEAIKNANPGSDVEVISVVPIDSKTEIITVSIKKYNKGSSIKKL